MDIVFAIVSAAVVVKLLVVLAHWIARDDRERQKRACQAVVLDVWTRRRG